MRQLSAISAPVVRILTVSSDVVLGALGVRPSEVVPVTEEEVRVLLAQGTRAGVFEETEQDIVEAVFRLGDRRASSLMTPRPDVVWLDLDRQVDELLGIVIDSKHSRFAVGRGSLDNVVGIAAARDILAPCVTGGPLDIVAVVQRPLYVPETLPAFRLLELFKQQGSQFAILIDEYGGVQGIVTLRDILEAIVGEVPTAEELAEPSAVQREDGSWLLDGILPMEEVQAILELKAFPEEGRGDYYSLGGMVMQRLGRIPAVGDHFHWQGRRFEVVDMDENRVDKVLVAPDGKVSD
jgi:putative hemolysin